MNNFLYTHVKYSPGEVPQTFYSHFFFHLYTTEIVLKPNYIKNINDFIIYFIYPTGITNKKNEAHFLFWLDARTMEKGRQVSYAVIHAFLFVHNREDVSCDGWWCHQAASASAVPELKEKISFAVTVTIPAHTSCSAHCFTLHWN